MANGKNERIDQNATEEEKDGDDGRWLLITDATTSEGTRPDLRLSGRKTYHCDAGSVQPSPIYGLSMANFR